VTKVEVEALASTKDLAAVLHAKETTVSNWASRRAWTGFPMELGRVAGGRIPLYDKYEVIRWYANWQPQRAIPKVGGVSEEDLKDAGV